MCKPNTEIDNYKIAYENLLRKAKSLHNELCLKCGNYKEEHKGACDGCRWREGL